MARPVSLSPEQKEILEAMLVPSVRLIRIKGEFPFAFMLCKEGRSGVCYRAAPVVGLLRRKLLVEDPLADMYPGIWPTVAGLALVTPP